MSLMIDTKPQTPALMWIAATAALLGLVTSVVSLLGVFAVIVRLATKTEVELVAQQKHIDEVGALARATADKFNGEARAAHEQLSGRVSALEQTAAKGATAESVTALQVEMRQGFAHLTELIRAKELNKDR